MLASQEFSKSEDYGIQTRIVEKWLPIYTNNGTPGSREVVADVIIVYLMNHRHRLVIYFEKLRNLSRLQKNTATLRYAPIGT